MNDCTDTGGCTGDCRQGRDCEGSRRATRHALGADEAIDLTVSFIVGLVFVGFVWGLVDVALQHGWTP